MPIPKTIYKISLIAVLFAGIATIFLLQFSIPTLFGADGYLHIRMAEFLKDYGPHYHFHWARFSTFTQNFADKDFIYHVLLVPFTFLPNIFWGAKLAAAIFAAVLYFVFCWALTRYCRARPLVPVFALVFFLSAPFLQALAQPRNMVLVIALTILFIHYLIQKRYLALCLVSIIYSLSHVSGPYLLLFAVLGETLRFAHERFFAWKSAVAVALGVAIGFLLHPNFPHNLLVFYLNGILVPVFALKWGLELGAEFFPMNTRDFVLGYPFVFIAVLLWIGLGVSRQKKISLATQIWMAIAGFFFVFSFFSQRYLIHAYPLVLIALAGYCSDWWQSRPEAMPSPFKAHKIIYLSLVAGSAALLLFIGMHTWQDFKLRLDTELIYNSHYEAVGKWMDSSVPPREVIFHTNWSDAQYFIGLNPKDDYLVTLDPIFMYYWDSKKYELYRQVSFGNNPDPYKAIKEVFGCQYGYCGKNYFSGLIKQIRSDSRFEVLGEDALGLVFKLR